MLLGTGASRGVLSDRLNWLQKIDCLRKDVVKHSNKRPTYHLTKKSIELYANGLMAMNWERSSSCSAKSAYASSKDTFLTFSSYFLWLLSIGSRDYKIKDKVKSKLDKYYILF